jgi:hypothetical protein
VLPLTYINAIQYNARGQTTRIDYADNRITQGYAYDAGITVMWWTAPASGI